MYVEWMCNCPETRAAISYSKRNLASTKGLVRAAYCKTYLQSCPRPLLDWEAIAMLPGLVYCADVGAVNPSQTYAEVTATPACYSNELEARALPIDGSELSIGLSELLQCKSG